MDYKYDWAELDRIDATDSFFRITTTQDKPSLITSIRRIGLISPIILKEVPDRLIVVSGFRRLDSCQQLLWPKIPCQILPHDTPMSHCAELAISSNTTQRSLNLIEQARCLNLLTVSNSGSMAMMEQAKLLNVPLNNELVAKLQTILSTSKIIQKGVLFDKISLPIALRLAEMHREDADAVALLFSRIPMGLNKQREVLQHLSEIGARDDISVKSLLADVINKLELNSSNQDGNLKSQMIRSYLKKMRYPRLVKVEKNFNQMVRELDIGKHIRIIPPLNFEGTAYSMTIRFDSLDALTHAHRRLARAIQHPAVLKLFDEL